MFFCIVVNAGTPVVVLNDVCLCVFYGIVVVQVLSHPCLVADGDCLIVLSVAGVLNKAEMGNGRVYRDKGT